MRAAVVNDVKVGFGAWITPFTPILSDVGAHEMWEGSPARLTGRCTELKRTANICQYGYPKCLLETLNILMGIILSFCLTVAVPFARASGCSSHAPNEKDERHPGTLDLDYHWAISAGARWGAVPTCGCLGVRRHVQPRPRACQRRLAGVLVQ